MGNVIKINASLSRDRAGIFSFSLFSIADIRMEARGISEQGGSPFRGRVSNGPMGKIHGVVIKIPSGS